MHIISFLLNKADTTSGLPEKYLHKARTKLRAALWRAENNRTKAAENLGVTPRTLSRWIVRAGLPKDPGGPRPKAEKQAT